MTFAALGFLAGLAALTLPWWLHRLDAHDDEQRTVSSLFLMRSSEAPLRAQKRLQYRLLLGARLLLLALAVLAFAQPMIPMPEQAPGTERLTVHAIVVDTSFSMQRSFAAAQRTALAVLDAVPAGDRAALITVSAETRMLAPPVSERSELRGLIAGLKATNARLGFEAIGDRVHALLAPSLGRGERLHVHVVTDAQRSAAPSQFNRLLGTSVLQLELHPITDAAPNWTVSGVTSGETTIDVDVTGFDTPQQRLTVTLHRDDLLIGEQSIDVEPSGRARLSFPTPRLERGDAELRAELADAIDVLPADDVRYAVQQSRTTTDIALGRGPTGTPGSRQERYMRTAIAATSGRFQSLPLSDDASVIVLVDPPALPPQLEQALRRRLESGGAAMVIAGPAVRGLGRVPLLDVSTRGDRITPRPIDRGVVVADTTHPAIGSARSWTDIVVSQNVRIAEGTGTTLLALDDGQSLLTEHRRGSGRVLLLHTALDPQWSTLVQQSTFANFVERSLAYLSEDYLPSSYIAGAPTSVAAAGSLVFDKDGRRVTSLQAAVAGSITVAQPGTYELRTARGRYLIAVNADPRESDLAPLDDAYLARWQKAATTIAADEPAAPATDSDDDAANWHDLAPWLLTVLLALAILEPVLANLGRRGATRLTGPRATTAGA